MQQIDKTTVQITKLGHQGDGLATTDSGTIAVPYTLADEIVRVQSASASKFHLLEVLKASPHRAIPPCPYFGSCGGCRLQHLDQSTYNDFKRQKIIGALAQQGLTDCKVHEPIQVSPRTRRRITLKAKRQKNQVLLGFYQRDSHHIIAIEQCLLVDPEIEALFSPLRDLVEFLLSAGEQIDILCTKADQGLDVVLRYAKRVQISLELREQLVAFAKQHKLCRLSIADPKQEDLIVCFTKPSVSFDGVPVAIQSTSFLQASAKGGDILAQLVTEAVPTSAKYVADLFCGRGTLALPLARQWKVDAYDAEEEALSALEKAARQAQRPIRVLPRNLMALPLMPKELARYGAVILDPPRSGALAQCQQLATSKVPTVVMVSCQPASFSRDAKELCAGGYRLQAVTPVDQFLWSSHIELVGVFVRS